MYCTLVNVSQKGNSLLIEMPANWNTKHLSDVITHTILVFNRSKNDVYCEKKLVYIYIIKVLP